MKSLAFVLGLTVISGGLAQQTQQGAAPATSGESDSKKPAVLEGRVVNGKTGEPVRRVTLSLRPFGAPGMMGAMTGPMAPAAPYAATTDAEGKFRIEKVEPGNYRLMAERQGFVRQEYGARQNSMIGTTIRLGPGQELKDLNFKLVPNGIITGRVVDEEGEPLSHVQIQTMRRRFFQGKQQLMPMGGGQTNDMGEFRVSDLMPGRFWISATYRGRMAMFGEAPARNTGDKPEEEYVTTYYPGSLDQSGARAIDVEAGQEVPGINIRMQKARVYRIRGKVASSAPVRNVRLMVVPRERGPFFGFFGMGAMVKEDGTFEIGGVQPGAYYVSALPMQGPASLVGKVAVDVAQENVENVSLVLGGGSTLKGSIRIDGDVQQLEQAQGKKITLGGVRVVLVPPSGLPFGGSPGVSTKDDGSFAIENAGPDKYRIQAFNTPQGTWLKSIRAGDQEVLDTEIDLSGGVPGPVLITLGVGPGQITGTVQDAKQQPASGGIVTLIPDPLKEQRNDLYRLTTTDQNGQFTMQGIPPGDYKVFAWEDVDPGSYMDPEFLKPHDSRAQKVTVKENSQQQISLSQIPAEALAAR